MNVDEFYAEDECRRASDEVSLGSEWRVASDPYVLYGIHWIEDTGEVYALRGPQPSVLDFSGEVGGSPVSLAKDAYEVTVLGRVATRDVLVSVLDGWQHQMAEPDSLAWARRRIADATGQSRP